MVHAEFKGVPFFRIEILVSVISRVQLVQIRRNKEFLVVEIEICFLVLLETERKAGRQMAAEVRMVVIAEPRCNIPVFRQVDFILQIECRIGSVGAFGSVIFILCDFIFVPVKASNNGLIIRGIGELIGNAGCPHAHIPVERPAGAVQVVVVVKIGTMAVYIKLVGESAADFRGILKADGIIIFCAVVVVGIIGAVVGTDIIGFIF